MERDSAFFREVPQFEGSAGGFKFPMPLFYYDASAFFVVYAASYSEVCKLLPSPRLKPYRAFRKFALLGLAAFSYRDTDIGPYNEFAVAVPVTMDVPDKVPGAALVSGIAHPTMFITHLPVTTEIALAAGKEVYNFPKFVASIDFERGDNEISVLISDGDQHILTLTIPSIQGKRNMQMRVLTSRSDKILRCEIIAKANNVAIGSAIRGVKLSLGKEHFMARDLADLKLVRPLAVTYIPNYQLVLTNPLDSQPVMKK
jgi:hypothetical protein